MRKPTEGWNSTWAHAENTFRVTHVDFPEGHFCTVGRDLVYKQLSKLHPFGRLAGTNWMVTLDARQLAIDITWEMLGRAVREGWSRPVKGEQTLRSNDQAFRSFHEQNVEQFRQFLMDAFLSRRR